MSTISRIIIQRPPLATHILGLALVMAAIWTPSYLAVRAATFTAEELFRKNHLLDVQIKLAPADWLKLCGQGGRGFANLFGGGPREERFSQFEAEVTIEGKRIPNVGIRKKGFIGSLDETCPSLKIKFDEYVDQSPIDGLDRITLNNNKQDQSLASQYLTYMIFNKAGIPAPRVSFAKVTVNGEYLGVYSHVESVRTPFLKHHYGNAKGEFYEGTIADFYPRALSGLEKKNKQTRKDQSQAIRLAEILADKQGLDLEAAEKLVNIEQFIRFWAIESLLGFWDGYTNNQNNFFAFANPQDQKRFYFMPWGADGAFTPGRGPMERFRRGNGESQAPKSIYGQSMLANRLYHTEGIPDRYKTTMQDLLKTVWNEEEIIQEVERIDKLTRDHLHPRQDRAEEGIDRLMAFVENRRVDIESELKTWPVAIQDKPRIPAYTVEIGNIKARFDTIYKTERNNKVSTLGVVDIQMQMDGENVTLSQIGALGQPEEPPGRYGRFRRGNREAPDPKPTITFQGVRESDGHEITMILTIEAKNFEPGGEQSVDFQGNLLITDPNEEDESFGFRRFFDRKTLKGNLLLEKAGLTENDSISGEMELLILETRGGFGRRR
ncbi:MAG: CotH kinase family protein [Verrucomicrobiota bacterium]|nr:CotH kinase family protein [Verrucomicrobiota bacterium]